MITAAPRRAIFPSADLDTSEGRRRLLIPNVLRSSISQVLTPMIQRPALLAIFLLFLSVLSIRSARTADDKPLDAHEIMEKANKPGGPYFNVVRELKAKDPDWEDVQSDSAELKRLASALGKTTPPKGDPASWKSLTSAYTDTATALEKAARAKNLAAARAAIARMGDPSCTACHKLHRKD